MNFPQLMTDVQSSLLPILSALLNHPNMFLVWGTEAVSHFPEWRKLNSLHIIYYINSAIV